MKDIIISVTLLLCTAAVIYVLGDIGHKHNDKRDAELSKLRAELARVTAERDQAIRERDELRAQLARVDQKILR